MGFKLRFKTSSALRAGIEKDASELKTMIGEIENLNRKLNELFKTLKEAKKKLTKLKVQESKLKEKSPRIINLYAKNEELVIKFNLLIEKNIKDFLKLLSAVIARLRDITFDSDTLFYREDKRLTRLALEVKGFKDARMRHRLLVLINHVKETMKSITLKLLEASRLEEEEVMVYPSRRKITGVPKKIKELGVKVGGPEKLDIKYISQGLKAAMEQIIRLKAIELDVLVIMPSIDRRLAKLKERMYLLEEDFSKKILKYIEFSEKRFKYIKSKIAKQAQNLFETIEIIGEK